MMFQNVGHLIVIRHRHLLSMTSAISIWCRHFCETTILPRGPDEVKFVSDVQRVDVQHASSVGNGLHSFVRIKFRRRESTSHPVERTEAC